MQRLTDFILHFKVFFFVYPCRTRQYQHLVSSKPIQIENIQNDQQGADCAQLKSELSQDSKAIILPFTLKPLRPKQPMTTGNQRLKFVLQIEDGKSPLGQPGWNDAVSCQEGFRGIIIISLIFSLLTLLSSTA